MQSADSVAPMGRGEEPEALSRGTGTREETRLERVQSRARRETRQNPRRGQSLCLQDAFMRSISIIWIIQIGGMLLLVYTE